MTPAKGCFDGECNRTACNVAGSRYYNFRTHGYYCADCARKIDIVEVTDPTQPSCFDYPQRPDTSDRHTHINREKPFAENHPDKK